SPLATAVEQSVRTRNSPYHLLRSAISIMPRAAASGSAMRRIEDRLRQQRGDGDVRQVDDVADPEVDGDAADDVGLLARKAALAEQLDHLDEGVARRQRQILALLGPVLADRHTYGGDEVGGRRPFRP